jgi:hypothetical protein
MSCTSSDSLHEAIQKALLAGDFDTVRQLSTSLGQTIVREAQTAAPSERQALVQKELNRINEHLNFARVLRAHVASRLQENTAVSLYLQSSTRGHSWRFDA